MCDPCGHGRQRCLLRTMSRVIRTFLRSRTCHVVRTDPMQDPWVHLAFMWMPHIRSIWAISDFSLTLTSWQIMNCAYEPPGCIYLQRTSFNWSWWSAWAPTRPVRYRNFAEFSAGPCGAVRVKPHGAYGMMCPRKKYKRKSLWARILASAKLVWSPECDVTDALERPRRLLTAEPRCPYGSLVSQAREILKLNIFLI